MERIGNWFVAISLGLQIFAFTVLVGALDPGAPLTMRMLLASVTVLGFAHLRGQAAGFGVVIDHIRNVERERELAEISKQLSTIANDVSSIEMHVVDSDEWSAQSNP